MAELILVAAMLNHLDYNVEIDVLWANTKSGIQCKQILTDRTKILEAPW
jgi:hypothetical protein